MHVGNGRADHSDMDIVRDGDGNAFIPSAGFVGMLRHAFRKYTTAEIDQPQHFKDFWGYAENDGGRQSKLCCSDLTLVENTVPEVIIRDGIRLDNKRGIVDSGGKFDFELLERGARFLLNLEFTYGQDDESFVKRTVRTIDHLLANKQVRIGAKTNSGFGRIGWAEKTAELYWFDFSCYANGSQKTHGSPQKDVLNWLRQNFSEQNSIPTTALGEPFNMRKACFRITAQLRLRNSLIVRSYARDARMPDTTQLQSRGDWVIPGTSLKGAIRGRAERIVNTLRLENADRLINDLFGQVDDKNRSKGSKKGRMRIEEITLSPDDFPAESQTRIRIDRFTGGVIEGGLFDSMPIFAPRNDKAMTLCMEIDDFKDSEAGLLLLVLKDLWSGDLAVGGEKNIGRGIFQGERAEIAWNGKTIVLEKALSALSENQKATLQGFVSALHREQN